MELRVELENNTTKEHNIKRGMGIYHNKRTKHYMWNVRIEQQKHIQLSVELENNRAKEHKINCGMGIQGIKAQNITCGI